MKTLKIKSLWENSKTTIDVRNEGDDFLSNATFFAVRELFKVRHEKNFEEILKTHYIFSERQLNWLKDDLADDLEDLEDYYD